MEPTISQAEIDIRNNAFERWKAQPQAILRWLFARFGDDIEMALGFGYEGMALLDMAIKVNPLLRVFTIDTEFLFPETYELAHNVERRYGITIKRYRPKSSDIQQFRCMHGPYPAMYANPDRPIEAVRSDCCHARKVLPLREALTGLHAWISAIQRSQGGDRANARILSLETIDGRPIAKACPLAHWTKEQTWDYIKARGVPYNPLHDQNYPSIGCTHCTTTVSAGESDRAGRWRWSANKECGIHS